MSGDPARDAAERAWADGRGPTTLPEVGNEVPRGLIAAAREALAPLRAKHQKVQRPDGSYRCTSCRDAYGSHADWPTGTDRLVYSEEELDV